MGRADLRRPPPPPADWLEGLRGASGAASDDSSAPPPHQVVSRCECGRRCAPLSFHTASFLEASGAVDQPAPCGGAHIGPGDGGSSALHHFRCALECTHPLWLLKQSPEPAGDISLQHCSIVRFAEFGCFQSVA